MFTIAFFRGVATRVSPVTLAARLEVEGHEVQRREGLDGGFARLDGLGTLRARRGALAHDLKKKK